MKKLIRVTTVPISIEKLLGNQLTYMNQFYEVVAISSDQKELQSICKKLRVRHYAIEMTRSITPFKDVKAIYQMYQFFRQEKPEIVHSHTPKAGLVAMIAAFFARVPVRLHTVAGLPLLESTGWKRKLLIAVEKLTYLFCTRVYPNSNELRKWMVANNLCRPEKLKVIGNGSSNGIDLEYFNPETITNDEKQNIRERLSIKADDFVFVFVGRVVKDKGINELVAAFKRLVNETCKDVERTVSKPGKIILHDEDALFFDRKERANPNIKLLLVGPLEQDLNPIDELTLSEIQHSPFIISTGYKSDVRPYLAISHCLVFPSYREGLPNVVLQAGAMKLPSIVSNINGCNEIIENQYNGLIIPVKNEYAIFESMQKIMEDPALYNQLRNNSRARIASRYSHIKVWEAMKEEYNHF